MQWVINLNINLPRQPDISGTTGQKKKPKEKEGKEAGRKMADERKGMMESGNASCDVRQSKKTRKEGRKGKQVELLMLAIMFLPGQSISRTCYDIAYAHVL